MPLIKSLPKTPGNSSERMADECEQARALPGWLKVHLIWQAWKIEFPYWAHSAWKPKVKRPTLGQIRAEKEEEELLSS